MPGFVIVSPARCVGRDPALSRVSLRSAILPYGKALSLRGMATNQEALQPIMRYGNQSRGATDVPSVA